MVNLLFLLDVRCLIVSSSGTIPAKLSDSFQKFRGSLDSPKASRSWESLEKYMTTLWMRPQVTWWLLDNLMRRARSLKSTWAESKLNIHSKRRKLNQTPQGIRTPLWSLMQMFWLRLLLESLQLDLSKLHQKYLLNKNLKGHSFQILIKGFEKLLIWKKKSIS